MTLRHAYQSQGLLYIIYRGMEREIPAKMKTKHHERIMNTYRWFHSRDLRQYVKYPQPFKLQFIDPDEVNQLTRFEYPSSSYYIGKVSDGNWNLTDALSNTDHPELYRAKDIEGILLFQSIRSHFLDDVPWEETKFFQEVIEIIERGESVWHGCSSYTDVIGRCNNIDAIFNNIASQGYKSKRERMSGEVEDVFRLYTDEILVDVDRNGDLCLADGFHRYAIAKVLELDNLPVIIRVRHREPME